MASEVTGLRIRRIRADDNAAMAQIIRTVMAEFGAIGANYSSSDAEVDTMYEAYQTERSAYFVVERGQVVVAGGGVAPLRGAEPDVCELRKMYALSSARGLGAGQMLLDASLAAARTVGFRLCYLETLGHMHAARALYEKCGFSPLSAPMGSTGHSGCDGWYARAL